LASATEAGPQLRGPGEAKNPQNNLGPPKIFLICYLLYLVYSISVRLPPPP